MLEKLGYHGKRIFDVNLSDDKTMLVLTEACDIYFDASLTKEQVIELANDFLRIADEMANAKLTVSTPDGGDSSDRMERC